MARGHSSAGKQAIQGSKSVKYEGFARNEIWQPNKVGNSEIRPSSRLGLVRTLEHEGLGYYDERRIDVDLGGFI